MRSSKSNHQSNKLGADLIQRLGISFVCNDMTEMDSFLETQNFDSIETT